ncbi:MAG: hypothetical protein KC478_01270 [Bacteriovoracaceae bacterium]|nr:hypothetical protein [Bacteriovoracaceae bacterium]
MPYILSPIIRESFEGMWFEGSPYKKNVIYDIDSKAESSPPVNYSSYTLKPHSLPHIETPAHTQSGGSTIEHYFNKDHHQHFWGKTVVLKLKGNEFKSHPSIDGVMIWEISKDQIENALKEVTGSEQVPERLIISLEKTPLNSLGLHDPNYVLILSQEAADYITKGERLKLYGTSWKSSDFMPGKKQRPIHNTLFQCALIMECLDLDEVPAGTYFMSAFALPLEGASESPVCPILYTKEEVLEHL